MKMPRDIAKNASRAALKMAIGPAIVWTLYMFLSRIFAAKTVSEGIVSPGAVDFGLLLLAAVVLFLRGTLVFVLPPVIVYQVSARVLRCYRDHAPRKGIDPTGTGESKAAPESAPPNQR